MGIIAIIREALRIARTHKSLWLFGFLVGFGGNVDFGSRGGEAPTLPDTPPDLGAIWWLVLLGVAVFIVFIVLRFVSTGALIEGVKRVRGNGSMSVREGFREGWAHWGVLLRITLLFIAANGGSVVLLFGACYLVGQAFGTAAMIASGALAVIVGVPWIVTLYMWQAFAERIAVFENRRALDAIGKARLFLHGRLPLGLKLFVANLLGVLFVVALAAVVIVPVVLLLRSGFVSGALPSIAIGVLTVVPAVFAAIATIGIVTSSVWTIGYLTQVEQ